MSETRVGDYHDCHVNRATGEIIPMVNSDTYEERERRLQVDEHNREIEEKLQKNSPYKTFAQLNTDERNMFAIRELIGSCPVAAQILIFLIEHADRHNIILCSSKVLEEALSVSRTTIFRAVQVLQNGNYVKILKSGTSNVFVLNSEIAWKSWGKNYQHAEFSAQVILTQSEQEKFYKAKSSVKEKRRTAMELPVENENMVPATP